MPEQTDVRPFRDRITLGAMSWREFLRAWEEVPEQVEEHFRIVSAAGHTVRPELKLVPERIATTSQTITSGPPRDWKPDLTNRQPTPRAVATFGASEEHDHE